MAQHDPLYSRELDYAIEHGRQDLLDTIEEE